MSKPRQHVFVCVNQRPPGHEMGCCADKNGEALADRFKEACRRFGKEVRVSRARCLGPCQHGANVVVYPDAVWYAKVTVDDVETIVSQHLEEGKPVARLLNPDMK